MSTNVIIWELLVVAHSVLQLQWLIVVPPRYVMQLKDWKQFSNRSKKRLSKVILLWPAVAERNSRSSSIEEHQNRTSSRLGIALPYGPVAYTSGQEAYASGGMQQVLTWGITQGCKN
jgi:hypothetical protein